MKNFIFIEKNIDVSGILKQLDDNPQDWSAIKDYPNIGGKTNPYGFLPLVMGVLKPPYTQIKDSEFQRNTPMYDKYTEVKKFFKKYNIKKTSRAAFFKLNPNDSVGRHIDDGKYYLTRDRYHLALRGTYLYSVGDTEDDVESFQIEPGTFFWFANKKYHWSWNNGTEDRLTLVFDLPYSQRNPHHQIYK